jgi:multiple sugar transport system substrate-binding protein
MIMRRRWIAIAAVAAAALALSGCGGSSSASSGGSDFSATPSGTLKAWAFDNADDVGKARLAYAAKQLKGVKVDLDATSFDAQKFTTRLASGNVPDVVQMDRQFVTQYAAQGLIKPLNACFSAHKVNEKTWWYGNVIDDVTYQNQVWAAPQFYQPPAILLNMKALDAAGVTPDQIDTSKPDELLAAIGKLYTQSGGVPTRLGFDPVATGQTGLWILGQGGKLADKNGKPTLDDPANVKGIDLLKKIVDAQGGFAKVKSFSDSFDSFGDKNQFVSDQVAAQVDAQWYPNVLSPYLSKIDLQAVPFKDSSGKPFSVAGGTSFVIPAGAKNPDAACAWMIALTSQEAWMAAGQARADTIKTKGGANTGLFTGSPQPDKQIRSEWVKPTGNTGFDQVIGTYYDVVGYGTTFGSSPAGQTIQSELVNAVAAALLGQKSPQAALKDAQAAAMQAYQQATKKK